MSAVWIALLIISPFVLASLVGTYWIRIERDIERNDKKTARHKHRTLRHRAKNGQGT